MSRNDHLIALDEFTHFRFLSNLTLSPNAKNAAFVVKQSNEEKDGYLARLWVMDCQTHRCRQLTSGKNDSSYLWMDDDTILFASSRERKKEEVDATFTDYYEISLNGGEGKKVMTIAAPVQGLKKINDNVFLAEVEYDVNWPESFLEMEREKRIEYFNSRAEEKDYEVFDELPWWRNGVGITNKKRSRLCLYHRDTQQLEPLTDLMYQLESWNLSEDGRTVVYSGSPFVDLENLKQELVEIDLETKVSTVLLPLVSWNIHNALYAGDKILVLANENKYYGINENCCLYEYNRETKALELLSDNDRTYYNSVGSDCRLGGGKNMVADENGLTYLSTERSNSVLMHCDFDGHVSPVVSREGSVDCFDLKNGELLYVAMRGDKLQELYTVKAGEEICLTDFNTAALEEKAVSTPKRLNFTNNDDVEIDGWVIEPVDYDPAKSYPAILDIHGGPKTVYGNVFFHEMQYWASQGYFVFFCNPRGGDGRGNKFADIRGKYGQDDFEDIMQFADYVLWNYPQIDKSRVGVTGGSYGGFMTNWIIGHTHRFAAAASQRSISNWISMEGTSDIGPYFGLDQSGGDAWTDFEKAWKHSPLKYADKCSTPTLFIHSDEDYRCWQVEAYQMYSALKVHGVESRICLFHGENHDLSRSGKPKHRIRRLKEITEWFDKYLKEDK